MIRSMEATVAAPRSARSQHVWTAGYLAFVLGLTAEDVARAANGEEAGMSQTSRREWTWIQTAQRLTWQYGEAEALRRLNGYGA
ncbi:MAG: hypothetical protein DI570_09265 [Phenylobacterium zucineum]|nr:MAG: hypothetical protein DI570_09265 [Phenylobacterium zucineum]